MSSVVNIEKVYRKRRGNAFYNTSYPLNPSDWGVYRTDKPLVFNSETDLSLYVHVPFCQQLCSFCEYTRMGVPDEELQFLYIESLGRDMYSFLERHPNRLQGFDIGGGTPTALTDRAFARLMEICRDVMAVSSVCDDFEPSVEGTFQTVTKEKLDMMTYSGFYRLSLGVQSSDASVVRSAHRSVSDWVEMKGKIRLARQSGIRKVNLDFIYGLQNQTAESLQKDIRLIQELRPEQVTLYELRTNMIREQSHMTAADRYAMYVLLYDRLLAMGYHAPFGQNTFSVDADDMGVSSYLRHRMRDGSPYKGFGLAAQSMSGAGVSYNVGKGGRRLRALLKNRTYGEEYTYLLPPEELAAKYIAIAAYSGAFSMSRLSEILQREAGQVYACQLTFCQKEGLMQQEGDLMRITRRGFEHYGAVFSLFYDNKDIMI